MNNLVFVIVYGDTVNADIPIRNVNVSAIYKGVKFEYDYKEHTSINESLRCTELMYAITQIADDIASYEWDKVFKDA